MIKKLMIAAAAFSMATLPAMAGERAALWNQDVRPVQTVSDAPLQSQQLDLQRASDEEAWYPGCLAVSVIGGIDAVNECGDAWYPACLATGIITTVDNVQSCSNE